MESKRKTYLLIGLFILAIIIAVAIYVGIKKSQTTITTTTGGTTTTSSPGIVQALAPALSFLGL